MTATQAETADTETVAVLGAGGTMGFPIARNIARAGIPVRAWNRSRDKAEALTKDGVMASANRADGSTARDSMAPQHPLWMQLSR